MNQVPHLLQRVESWLVADRARGVDVARSGNLTREHAREKDAGDEDDDPQAGGGPAMRSARQAAGRFDRRLVHVRSGLETIQATDRTRAFDERCKSVRLPPKVRSRWCTSPNWSGFACPQKTLINSSISRSSCMAPTIPFRPAAARSSMRRFMSRCRPNSLPVTGWYFARSMDARSILTISLAIWSIISVSTGSRPSLNRYP